MFGRAAGNTSPGTPAQSEESKTADPLRGRATQTRPTVLELPRSTDKGSAELLCGPGTVAVRRRGESRGGAEERAALGAETECRQPLREPAAWEGCAAACG